MRWLGRGTDPIRPYPKLTLDGPRILFWDHNTGEQLWIDDDARALSLLWDEPSRAYRSPFSCAWEVCCG